MIFAIEILSWLGCFGPDESPPAALPLAPPAPGVRGGRTLLAAALPVSYFTAVAGPAIGGAHAALVDVGMLLATLMVFIELSS